MQRILSPERIEAYVKVQLGSRDLMKASELPLESVEDFIKIIYVRLYGTRKNMKYRIEKTEEKISLMMFIIFLILLSGRSSYFVEQLLLFSSPRIYCADRTKVI